MQKKSTDDELIAKDKIRRAMAYGNLNENYFTRRAFARLRLAANTYGKTKTPIAYCPFCGNRTIVVSESDKALFHAIDEFLPVVANKQSAVKDPFSDSRVFVECQNKKCDAKEFVLAERLTTNIPIKK